MTRCSRLACALVAAACAIGCRGKTVPTPSRSLPTVLGQETVELPPAQQAERQADVLGYLLKLPADYAREAEIEIDEDNVEDELAKIRAELATPPQP